ncbi:EmmdR/YeeO family multidrug/toxin efflux MATE transporter [Erwinia amylovora]|uniref:Multidrug-efflux transporter n=3 Tax=Erwinia amylovora TaxID=552 RepID=A0A831A443_ERWAM|nr:EmmdR/YeeO family multidrug/toxin efflux MATE transporter [Erwinia amylovora]ATZ11926.1 FMN/FAD transporter [Erwinia amylovora]EKV54915.1 putative MATE family transporter [Erwinia amylovora ACW56400]MBZ2389064.1 EmmdR/YeeO family multidrug/toxin efflux MATE transporter [Erwinia amylovora]MBZ2395909.1 EmmdR/YeeO family multidrug/toxin efflux MATE transporter [Erwinia amylovora]MBZ2398681.1 EmmdR/YeeO family multidrug/toxin efflux MATE transporter [Erwinia amylovora]
MITGIILQKFSVSLLQAIKGSAWYPKRRAWRVIFWREITPLTVPIFFENLCVLLMGVLSTFLVSWLGKEAMAGVGLADSFNIVVISFFAAIDLGTTVVVAFSLGRLNRDRAVAAARQSLIIMTGFAVLLALAIEFIGPQIVDLIAGKADPQVKVLALSYLQVTAWSYPAAAIALIGCGALRGAGNTNIPMLINGGMNILNIAISSVLIYGCFSWHGMGFVGAGLGLTISRYIGAAAVIYVLAIGFVPALKISLKSYFTRLNSGILREVLGIGVPASIESVLFNGGKLLTQVFVAGMGTDVIAGNFIAISIVSLINLPGNALGSAATIIVGTRLGRGQLGQPERVLRYIFWLSTLVLSALSLMTVPFAGLLARFYSQDESVVHIVKVLVWLNAAFMPFWAASWVLPAGLKGARDARYTMWISLLSMWCGRIIAGYLLGIVLGLGVVGIWLGMVLDWIIRGRSFYRRMDSGRWLWKYRPQAKGGNAQNDPY